MNHLNDNDIQSWLDQADPETAARVEAHLAICPECRELAGQYKALYSGISRTEIPELAPGFADRVMSAIPETEAEPEKDPIWVPVFGISLVMAGAAFIFYFLGLNSLSGFAKNTGEMGSTMLSDWSQIFSRSVFGLDLHLIISIGLILLAVAGIDFIIRHARKRPISFMI